MPEIWLILPDETQATSHPHSSPRPFGWLARPAAQDELPSDGLESSCATHDPAARDAGFHWHDEEWKRAIRAGGETPSRKVTPNEHRFLAMEGGFIAGIRRGRFAGV